MDVVEFRRRRLLPFNQLHPPVVYACQSPFLAGKYDSAVFEEFKALEVAVRDRAQYPDEKLRREMMLEAFHFWTGPLREPEVHPNEREALRQLYAAAIDKPKNPLSHRHVE